MRGVKIAVPFVWFGMVLAISFMEAPLKFQAPGIDLPLGLGIGRLVFFALNKMEIVCGLLLFVAFLWRRPNPLTQKVLLGLVLLILAVETLWLLPVLDARAEQVINGTAPPYSAMHLVYIVLDGIKIMVLLVLGIITVRHDLGP
ncbi:MAG: hypothetical protein AB7V18_15360 [Pyrinomonadaceae bacterium]